MRALKADERFDLLAPVEMGAVCFRARVSGDKARDFLSCDSLNEMNERLLMRVNETGATYLTHTRLHGRLALRIAVGNVLTTETHLARAWRVVCAQLATPGDEATASRA